MTTTYTKIAKPVGTAYTNVANATKGLSIQGSPIGLLLALTYATSQGTPYTKVANATGTIYTKITKAT